MSNNLAVFTIHQNGQKLGTFTSSNLEYLTELVTKELTYTGTNQKSENYYFKGKDNKIIIFDVLYWVIAEKVKFLELLK